MTISSRDFNRHMAARAVASVPAKPRKMKRPKPIARTPMDVAPASMSFWIPMTTVSEMNARDNRWSLTERKQSQRDAVRVFMGRPATLILLTEMGPPYVVTLCRVAARKLDGHDNLRASLKYAVDAIAELLGVDDGDEGAVEWKYDQTPDAFNPEIGPMVWVKVERGGVASGINQGSRR